MDFLCDTSGLYTIHDIEVDLLCDTSGLCLQHGHVFMCITLSRSHRTEVPAVWHHRSLPTKENWRISCLTPWCSTNDAKLKDLLCSAIAFCLPHRTGRTSAMPLHSAYHTELEGLLQCHCTLPTTLNWKDLCDAIALCLPHGTGGTCAMPLHSAYHTELEGLVRPLYSAHRTDPKDLLSDSVRMHKQLQMYFCSIWKDVYVYHLLWGIKKKVKICCVQCFGMCMSKYVTWCFTPSQPVLLYQGKEHVWMPLALLSCQQTVECLKTQTFTRVPSNFQASNIQWIALNAQRSCISTPLPLICSRKQQGHSTNH